MVRFAVHLDVIVDGRRVTVPPGIGVDRRDRQVAALYTSDGSGIIHVNSTRRDPVTVYLNGSPVTGPPGSLMLTPHQEIAVTCRPGRTLVPAGYAFPPGT